MQWQMFMARAETEALEEQKKQRRRKAFGVQIYQTFA